MKKDIPYKIILLCCLLVLFFSCAPTKYLRENEYLLNRVKIVTDNKDVSISELKKTVRQKPNTRILGVARFHLEYIILVVGMVKGNLISGCVKLVRNRLCMILF